jgi:hypothetical protein
MEKIMVCVAETMYPEQKTAFENKISPEEHA